MKKKLILIMAVVLSFSVFAVEVDDEKLKKILKDFSTLKTTVIELKKDNDAMKALLISEYIKTFKSVNSTAANPSEPKDLTKATLIEISTEINNLKNPPVVVVPVTTEQAIKVETPADAK